MSDEESPILGVSFEVSGLVLHREHGEVEVLVSATMCPTCFAFVATGKLDAHVELLHPPVIIVTEDTESPWTGTAEDRHGLWIDELDRYEDGCVWDIPHDKPWSERGGS